MINIWLPPFVFRMLYLLMIYLFLTWYIYGPSFGPNCFFFYRKINIFKLKSTLKVVSIWLLTKNLQALAELQADIKLFASLHHKYFQGTHFEL